MKQLILNIVIINLYFSGDRIKYYMLVEREKTIFINSEQRFVITWANLTSWPSMWKISSANQILLTYWLGKKNCMLNKNQEFKNTNNIDFILFFSQSIIKSRQCSLIYDLLLYKKLGSFRSGNPSSRCERWFNSFCIVSSTRKNSIDSSCIFRSQFRQITYELNQKSQYESLKNTLHY